MPGGGGCGDVAARGIVYLIGAGPGDPELLTLRGVRLLQQADAVLYDHLVNPAILEHARAGAALVDVGKRHGHHSAAQDEINRMLVDLARRGRTVARLKGGDPLVFGRGGEELEALAAHGVRFEVVPGVSAANGAAAYAGIPLTHRDYCRTCVLVTGHSRNGRLELDWPALARPRQTLVAYMAVATLGEFTSQLLLHGLSADTPAAAIERGTTAAQRVVAGTLSTLHRLASEACVKPPALIVIGEVVKLRRALQWFVASASPADIEEIA